MRANSSGSTDALWSGPLSFLLSVKCFSIADAPSATAATGTATLVVWSESPTGTLNFFCRVFIASRLTFSTGQGYSDVHWNNRILLLPVFLTAETAALISGRVAIPVDKRTGFFFDAAKPRI